MTDRAVVPVAVLTLVFTLGNLLPGLEIFCRRAFAGEPAVADPVAPAAPAATRVPRAERGFESRAGWIGGDGASSLSLASDTILWLFGDSFYGTVRGGRRFSRVMVHNAVALQQGRDPAKARWRYWFGKTDPVPVGVGESSKERALPGSFFQPPDRRGYFWPLHGIRTGRGLFVFLLQIEPTQDDSVFGFRPVGSWLVQVPLTDLSRPPDSWRCIYRRIPWSSFTRDRNRFFGSAVVPDADGMWVYGIDERCPDPPTGKSLLLARISGDDPCRFGNWRILETPGNEAGSPPVFGVQLPRAAEIADGLSTEFSVHRSDCDGRFILIHMAPALSPEIVARTASSAAGPWSPPRSVFRCPVETAAWCRGNVEPIKGPLFAYAAKAHPELDDGRGGQLVTWVVNSFDFFDLARAEVLYRPRFIRVPMVTGPGFETDLNGSGKRDPFQEETGVR